MLVLPLSLLDVAFLVVDVVLDALIDDNFVVSSFVSDDLEALDVHFPSDSAR